MALIRTVGPVFVSENNGFDWQFINWYFHHFTGANPFGFSSTNLGSLYKGLVRDTSKNFNHLQELQSPAEDSPHEPPSGRRAGGMPRRCWRCMTGWS